MIARYGWVAVMIAVIAATMGFLLWYEMNLPEITAAPALKNGSLTNAQEKSIDTTLSLAQILIGWSIAIIGATAFFLNKNFEHSIELTKFDLFFSLVIILLCVISIYFGHLGIDKVGEMLGLNQFPARSGLIKKIFSYQYVVGLLALFLFGIHVIQFFWRCIER